MAQPLLGRSEEFMRSMSDKTKRQVLTKIIGNVREGIPLESACWAADVDPEIFGEWMKAEPRVRQAVLREYAILERTLVREVRQGGRGMSAAKAALEVLERQFKSWARKTNVTLSSQLNDALEELEKVLPAEHYETVLKVLAKHE
jgi:hypothetical protein